MPPQGRALVLPSLLRAAVPGAINLTADQLDGSFIVKIDSEGIPSQQTTLAQLQAFFMSPFTMPARVVTSGTTLTVTSTDVAILINKASVTTITLPTPSLGRILIFKDMAGNWGTYTNTLDAGAGKTINGAQTLDMNANYETTMLIGMSATQWGTLI